MRKTKQKLIATEIGMILLALIWFIPIYYLIVITLKTQQDATLNPLGLPETWEFGNYINAWVKMEFPKAFANTLIITVSAVFLLVLVGTLAGYAFFIQAPP